ncbi:MAG: type II secretion system protein GspN [Sorangium cellulosum]|nr:MAG: type II secretion system protein GspN [Sorangium cellulosum]
MNPRIRKILLWILFPTFYLISFLVFAYLTFPFNQVRDRIVVAFAEDQRKTGGDSRLEIDRISSYWFSGVEAHGVRLISAPEVKKDGTKGPPSEVEIESLTARISILPLLIGRKTVNFSAELLGGTLEGTTSKDGEDRTFSVELENLAVGRIAPLVKMIGLPLTGNLGGSVEMTLPEGKLSKATGGMDLTLADLSVGDGKTKIRDTIALPRMVVGELKLTCDISEGRVKVTKFAAGGYDLDFTADGKIKLRDKLAESQADLYLRFKFSDKYKAKDEKTQALFGAPGSKAPALFEIADPRIRRSKRPDGFYSWRAWGLLRTLKFDPAPTGASKNRGLRKKPKSPKVRGFMK